MSRTSEIFVVRHAQSQPRPDLAEDLWPLSERGQQQAEELKDRLLPLGLQALYSSPYPRSLDTLRPLARALGLEVRIVADLRERRLAGALVADWLPAFQRTWDDFDCCLPGGESSRACQARVRAAALGALAESPGQRIAAGSHGNAIALLLNSIDPSFGFAEWRAMRNPHVFRLTWDGADLGWDRDFEL